jgi:hypothetical protein
VARIYIMERTAKFDECGALRQTLLRKLNYQRRVSIGALAQLFEDKTALRKAVAGRWSECADFVLFATREELHQLSRSLHLWRLNSPLSMPSLRDLKVERETADNRLN